MNQYGLNQFDENKIPNLIKSREDILLIPSFYDIKWNRDFNNVLSKIFYCPFDLKFSSFLPSVSLKHEYIAKILPLMRSKKIKSIFIANITNDFCIDYINNGFVKNIYGFIHGFNFIQTEVGKNDKFNDYDLSIFDLTNKLFTNSKFMANKISNIEVIPIGLPIDEDFKEPNLSNKILFNHRLNSDKCPYKLLELPEKLRKDIVISTPKFSSMIVNKLKGKIKMEINPSLNRYREILNTCGIGLSFAERETFGTAVMEGIANGLLYFCPDNDTTCYRETCIKELLFKDIDDLIKKMEYYKNNEDERIKIVKKSQKKIEKFKVKNWIKRLLYELKDVR